MAPVDRVAQDGGGVPGEGVLDASLRGQYFFVGVLDGDGGEVVLALSNGAGAERVPAGGGGADPAQVGVALVAERAVTARASGDQQSAMASAGSDDEQAPAGAPGSVLGEAGGADLGAVGGGPAADGDLPVGVPVARVEAGQVERGSVERTERRCRDGPLWDAGQRGEGRDGRMRGGEGQVAGAGAAAAQVGQELGGGQAVGVCEVLEPGLDGLSVARADGDRQRGCNGHAGLRRLLGTRSR